MNNSLERFTSYIKSHFPVEYAEMVEDYPDAIVYVFFADQWNLWVFCENYADGIREQLDAEKSLSRDSMNQVMQLEDELDRTKALMSSINAEKNAVALQNMGLVASLEANRTGFEVAQANEDKLRKDCEYMSRRINDLEFGLKMTQAELNAERAKSFDLAHRLMRKDLIIPRNPPVFKEIALHLKQGDSSMMDRAFTQLTGSSGDEST